MCRLDQNLSVNSKVMRTVRHSFSTLCSSQSKYWQNISVTFTLNYSIYALMQLSQQSFEGCNSTDLPSKWVNSTCRRHNTELSRYLIISDIMSSLWFLYTGLEISFRKNLKARIIKWAWRSEQELLGGVEVLAAVHNLTSGGQSVSTGSSNFLVIRLNVFWGSVVNYAAYICNYLYNIFLADQIILQTYLVCQYPFRMPRLLQRPGFCPWRSFHELVF